MNFRFILSKYILNLKFLQVTWLEGHSLAQTMFTNLYLHNPYIIEDRTLKAFSIVMLKTVDLIRDRVNRASVFEEVWILFRLLRANLFDHKEVPSQRSAKEKTFIIKTIPHIKL